MTPEAGERLVKYVGDRIEVILSGPPGGQGAFLRTNLGRAAKQRALDVLTVESPRHDGAMAWRDIPMIWTGSHWSLKLALADPGFFEAKAYWRDSAGRQVWPEGGNVGYSVHPNQCRSANILYCAFPRLFGPYRDLAKSPDHGALPGVAQLDQAGYAVIPPSGKLRDLIQVLPHIFETLGCRILHLLPVNPTPTTYARMGRYGSPYACGDLTAIDPALVDFDKRTTGVEQFEELALEVHRAGGQVFLDIVINHTGWGATLQEEHPEWFCRKENGEFLSPGAWGNIWADLVELDTGHRSLWDEMADAFLVWLRRGVDGFRCDAGYMIPPPVWRYIVAKVRTEFPDALFLLEGLGGGWDETATLLGEGGMQWAYSELFQEYHGPQVAGYLEHALKQSTRAGTLIHYSETHDNLRLAAKGKAWSLLRNRLCALTSVCGGFGYTSGVEWLADEKIKVHGASALRWNGDEDIIQELSRLSDLLSDHPCFFEGASFERLSDPNSSVYGLKRRSKDNRLWVVIIANTDVEKAQSIDLKRPDLEGCQDLVDLLGQERQDLREVKDDCLRVTLEPAGVRCLAPKPLDEVRAGAVFRLQSQRRAWLVQQMSTFLEPEAIADPELFDFEDWSMTQVGLFLTALSQCHQDDTFGVETIEKLTTRQGYRNLCFWSANDVGRIFMVPNHHWLCVMHDRPFELLLTGEGELLKARGRSVAWQGKHLFVYWSQEDSGDFALTLTDLGSKVAVIEGQGQFLENNPEIPRLFTKGTLAFEGAVNGPSVLLTNGRGAMSRISVDLGVVKSKYDCLLGANLHKTAPVDRHVLVKRVRVWANANGFITPLCLENLISLRPGNPTDWCFHAEAGDGRKVAVGMSLSFIQGANEVVLQFDRGELDGQAPLHLSLTVRLDLEDRGFHGETKSNPDVETCFHRSTQVTSNGDGFEFSPSSDRTLTAVASQGQFHPAVEWSYNLPHEVERTRGQEGAGDAYSPGWFELPLESGAATSLRVVCGDPDGDESQARPPETSTPCRDTFEAVLREALTAFIVKRGEGKTVIAGYPWFLDWGRDTLICARGILAGGWIEEVRQIVLTFARFEEGGTLPNSLHGEDASNRDTSDAPLWFGVVCEDLVKATGCEFLHQTVDSKGRTVLDILRSIAKGYLKGTKNGIKVDASSGLVWSPSHFTWMDTNYPAGTPRVGYPIEIQALWICLLRFLERFDSDDVREQRNWASWAKLATDSVENYYWYEEGGYYLDLLIAAKGETAAMAQPDNLLRNNCLFAIGLGLLAGEKAKRTVEAAARHLIVPGGIRSLAPLKADPGLEIKGNNGQRLNDPANPYWGRYEGDEDTRRKPAYHNGTAWTWTFPVFCESLAIVYNETSAAVEAASAYLGSMSHWLKTGCLHQIPEILDGDAPHQERGCDAQAWGVSETLRVWLRLKDLREGSDEEGDL